MQVNKPNKFARFKSSLGDVSNLVKCPICLKVLINPVLLRCNHLFCDSCIKSTKKGKYYTCPVCQKNAFKKSVKPADEAKGVLKFLRNVSIQVNERRNADALKSNGTKRPRKCNTLTPDKKQDGNSKVKEPRNFILMKKPVCTETKKKGHVNISESKNTGQLGKKKDYVKEWLSNSQNMFLRKSQTQQPTPKESPGKNHPKNLASVSQKKRRTLPNTRSISKNEYERKYKSLELINTSSSNTKKNKKIDIYDIETPFEDETTIENIDTHPIMITKSNVCKFLEANFLQEIDQNCKRGKRKLEKRDALDKQTNWTRIKKFGNKVDYVKGIPKKLKVNTALETTVHNVSDYVTPNAEREDKRIKKKVVLKNSKATPPRKSIRQTFVLKPSKLKPQCRTTSTIASQNYDSNVNFSGIIEDMVQEEIKLPGNNNDVLVQTPRNEMSPGSESSTIPIMFKTEDLLCTKFNEFLTKFNEISNDFTAFIRSNEYPCSKLSLVHKSLQHLQPKFSSMRDILHTDSAVQSDFMSNQMTQTDYLSELKTSIVQTSPVIIPPKQVTDQGVQTENQKTVLNKSCQYKVEFSDTFDVINFETQIAIDAAKLQKFMKPEIHTNVLTEGMALSSIMRELQADTTHNTGWFEANANQLEEPPVVTKTPVKVCSESKLQTSCRKKLYDSPCSPITVTSKRVKRLAMSDSEEETPKHVVNKFIRDDVSLCFGSESQPDLDKMNSPVVDKYLDDVWERIQDELCTPDKATTKIPEAQIPDVNTAIKSNTQARIAKCEQMISAKPTKNCIHSWTNSSKTTKTLSKSGNLNPTATSSSLNMLSDSVFDDDFDLKNYSTPYECFEANVNCDQGNCPKVDPPPTQIVAVNILQDVQIYPPPPPTNSSEDLIFSTPESSPQKLKPTLETLPVLPPPPDFQDLHDIPQLPTVVPSQNTPGISPIKMNEPLMALRPSQRKRVTSTPLNKPVSISKLSQSSITHFVRKAPSATSVKRPFAALEEEDDDDLFVQKRVVVAATRLNKQQTIAISTLANRRLVRYSSGFDSTVTHLVVATNANNCAKDHTIKFVRAVAAGIWVVNFKWVQACLSQNKLIPEDNYEVCDVTGIDGPKQARLYHTVKPLFAGFKIYAAPPFVLSTPVEIQSIIRSLGGITVPSPEDLFPKDGHICVIVTETVSSQDVEQYEKCQDWMEKFQVVTVDVEWLTRSIGQYKLMSLRRFTLCPDDSLCDLGYPLELIQEVPFSSLSQY